ncbi:MAG TPA: hypothetical protein VGF91_13645 [Solirubrobacteraceae bacterium]
MNDYLDRVEAQLTELTEKGAHQRLWARRGGLGHDRAGAGPGGPRPPRRRNEALAFLAAAAVVAAVVAIVLVNAHHSTTGQTNASSAAPGTSHSATTSTSAQTSTTTTTASSTAPNTPGPISTPIPAHFAPQSFTAISELEWWVLGPAPCQFAGGHPPCGSILRTTDGGRHFIGLGEPHATLSSSPNQAGYSQIRFADADNGFAFGPNLYATHDGGETWTAVDVGGSVTDLAISEGVAYATVDVTSSGAAGSRLMRSPVSADEWTTVSAAGDVSGGLWVQGSDVFVQSGVGNGIGSDVLVSHDGGGSFTSYPSPGAGLGCQYQEPVAPILWAHCATGTESGVWRSTDAGAQFDTAIPSAGLSLPNSATFGAASDTTAVVGYQQLYRTDDDGQTYTPVGPKDVVAWAYLGFTDDTHGVALGYVGSVSPANERLYYTTDGGQSYHLVTVP